MSVLVLFFGWPNGAVWGNLIASLIWVPLAALPAYIFQRNHHKRVESKLNLIHKHMAEQNNVSKGVKK